MKRKVIQLAGNTHVVTLPAAWVKRFDIKKGEALEVEDFNTELIIRTDKPYKEVGVEVDISGLDQRAISWTCSALHKSGYDKITLIYDSKKQVKFVKDRIKNLFTGFIIEETTDTRIILKAISQDREDEFERTFRRAFRVTIQMAQETFDAIKSKNLEDAQDIIELEATNNQLTNFCERILNKRGHSDHRKTVFYYVIAWNLEKVCDNYKYMLNDLKDSKKIEVSKEIFSFFEETTQYLQGYYDLFYSFDLVKLQQLAEKRADLKEQMEILNPKSTQELKLVNHLLTLTTQITDFSASIVAIHTNPGNCE